MPNQVKKTKLPTKDQWYALESNRALSAAAPRSLLIKTLFALSLATLLIRYSPAALVVAWLFLVFGTEFWTLHLMRAYATLLVAQPSAMTDHMSRIAQQYRASVCVQCAVWGLASFISQVWLPNVPRVLCTSILILMMVHIIITCS